METEKPRKDRCAHSYEIPEKGIFPFLLGNSNYEKIKIIGPAIPSEDYVDYGLPYTRSNLIFTKMNKSDWNIVEESFSSGYVSSNSSEEDDETESSDKSLGVIDTILRIMTLPKTIWSETEINAYIKRYFADRFTKF